MDIDLTFFVQLGLFLVVLVVLNGFLFKPFLKVIEARYEQIHGARAVIDKLSRDAAADLEVYRARLREARDLAQREREALVSAGREEERRILNEVRNDVAKIIAEARKEVAAAEEEARQKLVGDTEVLSRRMVEKVLGREVNA